MAREGPRDVATGSSADRDCSLGGTSRERYFQGEVLLRRGTFRELFLPKPGDLLLRRGTFTGSTFKEGRVIR